MSVVWYHCLITIMVNEYFLDRWQYRGFSVEVYVISPHPQWFPQINEATETIPRIEYRYIRGNQYYEIIFMGEKFYHIIYNYFKDK